MHNHNKLLSYMDNCIGLKTGYTKAAGRTLVSCAEKNGQRLIAVTLQDGNDWADHQALYEFGFSAYPLRTLAVRGKTFTYLRVENGIGPLLPVTAADSFAWPTAETEEVTTELCWDAPACAPVTAGKTLGYVEFRLDGKEIGRVALLAGRTVLPKAASALGQLKGGA